MFFFSFETSTYYFFNLKFKPFTLYIRHFLMKMHYSSKTTTGVLFGNLFVDDSLTIDKITYHKHLFMNISN